MKILSLNSARTKSPNEVAFNVDVAPDAAALRGVTNTEISISYDNGVLMLRSKIPGLSIQSRHVVQAESNHNAELKRLRAEEVRKAEEHAKMIEEISSRLNINADTDTDD